ncbi:MAG: hypothetical protein SGARI_008070 [Bacillariaceae sp.]
MIQRGTPGRSAPRGKNDKSKRQYRVGELVRTELARIINTGHIKNGESFLDDDLRSRISIVSVDVSPDLRQARVSVSIRGNPKANSSTDSTVDKRRAYAWLVDNTKGIRHTLAQRMSHMKTSPSLTFVQVDVAAAVDVMYLIDQVSAGSYEREAIGEFGGNDDNMPRGYVPAEEFDEDDDDDDWEDEDDDFFDA